MNKLGVCGIMEVINRIHVIWDRDVIWDNRIGM